MSSYGGRRRLAPSRGPRTPSVAWRPGPIRKLATETLLTILDMASFDIKHNEFEDRDVETLDARTLGHLSRVSHEWRQLAITLRLRIITIDPTSSRTPEILRPFFSDPSLAKYVRSLTIARGNEGSDGGTFAGCASCGAPWASNYEPYEPSFTWRRIWSWAATLTNLEHLHVSNPSGGNESMAETQERESWGSYPMPAGAFSNVKSFYGSFEIDLSMAWWLLTGMASVEWLFLQGGVQSHWRHTPSSRVPPLPKLHPHLKQIRLDDCEITPAQFHQLISTATSLVALECRTTQNLSLDDIALALARRPNLKSLTWKANSKETSVLLLEIIGRSQLSHLEVRPWPLDDLFGALPETLESLALIRKVDISTLVSIQDQLPLLRVVTYTTPSRLGHYGYDGWGNPARVPTPPEEAALLPHQVELRHEYAPYGEYW
ncbi:hypothetical protein RQP46_000191 [Phenoliferia psychrophenolica]